MTRLLLLAVCLTVPACAHPLSRLETAAQRVPMADYVRPQRSTPACAAGVRQLEHAARRLGITIIYDPYLDDAHGRTNFVSQVRLEPTLREDSCGLLEVLAHELAHVLQPSLLYGDRGQVFADGVSYLVVRRYGRHDPIDRYSAFLAMFRTHLDVLRRYEPEIARAVSRLTGDR